MFSWLNRGEKGGRGRNDLKSYKNSSISNPISTCVYNSVNIDIVTNKQKSNGVVEMDLVFGVYRIRH